MVYNGFEVPSLPKGRNSSLCKLKGKSPLGDLGVPYFIFVGAVHPRKNVLGLLKAFEHFKATFSHPHQLVIVGRKAWMNQELEDFYAQMQFKKDVIWIEKIERTDLLELMQHAFGLVYPSLFEGFGIPILEAMTLGLPVICSNTSSMPEVAGNAALFVQPNNINEIATAMNELIINDELRNDLIAKGKTQGQPISTGILLLKK